MSIVIMDVSVTRMNARNLLEEGLFLVDADKDQWCKNHQDAKKYSDPGEAIATARKLLPTLIKPPRIFQVQQNGTSINIVEYKY